MILDAWEERGAAANRLKVMDEKMCGSGPAVGAAGLDAAEPFDFRRPCTTMQGTNAIQADPRLSADVPDATTIDVGAEKEGIQAVRAIQHAHPKRKQHGAKREACGEKERGRSRANGPSLGRKRPRWAAAATGRPRAASVIWASSVCAAMGVVNFQQLCCGRATHQRAPANSRPS